MNMKIAASVGALVVGATLAASAVAQVKPEVLVHQRQAAMALTGKYFGPIGAMVQGKAPFNAQVVERNAGYLVTLSYMAWDGFVESTSGVKSKAKGEIYKDKAKFDGMAKDMQEALAKLNDAAKSGNEGNVKTAFGAVGKTCKACHDDFREK